MSRVQTPMSWDPVRGQVHDGPGRNAAARGRSAHVRPDRAGLRLDEPADDGRARSALAREPRLAAVVRAGDRVLDVCCGTGDLAIAAREAGGEVTGLDFSEPMLARAREKSQTSTGSRATPWRCRSLTGRSMRRRWASGSATSTTSSAGSPSSGVFSCREAASRSSRSHGREGSSRPFYRLWFDGVIPLAGKVLPGGSAYSYLPASVRRFPAPEGLAKLLDEAGFDEISWRLFAGGIVALHKGTAR